MRDLLEESLPAMRESLGAEHPWTRNAREGLDAAFRKLARRDETALAVYRETLEIRLSTAEQPNADADALNKAAWELLTHDVEELRDASRALGLAERACARAQAEGGKIACFCLDTLALAQHRTGDPASAIATERLALSQLAEGVSEALVANMTNLRLFRAAWAEQQQATLVETGAEPVSRARSTGFRNRTGNYVVRIPDDVASASDSDAFAAAKPLFSPSAGTRDRASERPPGAGAIAVRHALVM
jgi:hypothetical protein